MGHRKKQGRQKLLHRAVGLYDIGLNGSRRYAGVTNRCVCGRQGLERHHIATVKEQVVPLSV
jgi:hypothetical protein